MVCISILLRSIIKHTSFKFQVWFQKHSLIMNISFSADIQLRHRSKDKNYFKYNPTTIRSVLHPAYSNCSSTSILTELTKRMKQINMLSRVEKNAITHENMTYLARNVQQRHPWSDRPEYIMERPIQPGANFTQLMVCKSQRKKVYDLVARAHTHTVNLNSRKLKLCYLYQFYSSFLGNVEILHLKMCMQAGPTQRNSGPSTRTSLNRYKEQYLNKYCFQSIIYNNFRIYCVLQSLLFFVYSFLLLCVYIYIHIYTQI